MDLAARYRPAGDGSLIGGDFYDVLPRDGRRRPRDRRRHRQGRARRRADRAGPPHACAPRRATRRRPSARAGRRQPHAAGRARRARALLHGRVLPARAQRLGARDDLLRRAPDADGRARRRARSSTSGGRARCSAGSTDPKLLDVDFELARARVARAVHRRRDRGAHDRRRLRPRRAWRSCCARRRARTRRGSPRASTAPRRARASAATTWPCSSLDAQEAARARGRSRARRRRPRRPAGRDQQREVDRVRRRDQREVGGQRVDHRDLRPRRAAGSPARRRARRRSRPRARTASG